MIVVGRRKPTYPRPTGFVGIKEVREGAFQAQIEHASSDGSSRVTSKRTSRDLNDLRAWRRQLERERDKEYPVQKCRTCGRAFHARPAKGRQLLAVYCTSICRREGKRREKAERRKASGYKRVETNILFDGTSYKVQVAGMQAVARSLDEARTLKAELMQMRRSVPTGPCPNCGVPVARTHGRRYCSAECRRDGQSKGILVRSGRATPANRRRWRERQREELRQYERELLEQGRPLLREMEQRRVHGNPETKEVA